MAVYQVTLIVFMVMCLVQGFAVTSRGVLFTEKVKTALSVLPLIILTALIISALLSKSLILAIVAVVFYLLFPGTGQTLALLVSGRVKQIGVLSWIVTALAVVAAYCVIFGRVVVYL